MTHEPREPDPQDSRQSGTDPRPALTSANVVDGIVRRFTNEIFALLGRDDFMAQLDFRCRALNNLFLGITPTDKYERSEWNSPSCLGEFLLKSRHISGETHHAARDFLMVFVAELLDVADPDNEFDGAVLEPLIVGVRDALLGLPPASSM
ncbi:hypothetical protein [Paraburkholderia sp. D1E]|uniref:hypothetical protein n=1 Tax=Paraburkholderia sp. D1E TaxID=3461398 RepID=UPI0040460EC9